MKQQHEAGKLPGPPMFPGAATGRAVPSRLRGCCFADTIAR